jgi:hypothetical protein
MTGAPLDYLLRRPWRDERLPFGVAGIPTMLSKHERRLLYALARDYASGDAAIVDAGCFLGGSTTALLGGVRDRGTRWDGPPVASYDLFRVEPYTVQKFFADDGVRVGDSFRGRFERNVAGFELPHVVHEGDITEIGWSGEPIDILFLDVLKTWEINDAVLRDFFPFLRPGRSVIVHQDYGCGWTPWIPITVELMGGALRLIDGVEWGSHVFFVQDELPAELLESGVSGLDEDAKFELVGRAIAGSEGWVRGMHEISRTELVFERDGLDAALRDLDRIRDLYAGYELVVFIIGHISRGLLTDGQYGEAPRRRRSLRRAQPRAATTA